MRVKSRLCLLVYVNISATKLLITSEKLKHKPFQAQNPRELRAFGMGFRHMGGVGIFRTFFKIMEKCGGINSHEFQTALGDRLQDTYVVATFTVTYLYLAAHAWNTATRAVRYTPEFFQCLFEDLTLNMLALFSVLLEVVQRDKFRRLIEFVEQRFSQQDAQELSRCAAKVRRMILTYIVLSVSMVVAIILQSGVPMSEEELNLRRLVYSDMANPQRVLPTSLKIPGVDETESWCFEFILGLQVILGTMCCIKLNLTIPLIPMFMLHLEGQYKILGKHCRYFGRRNCSPSRAHRTQNFQKDYMNFVTINRPVFRSINGEIPPQRNRERKQWDEKMQNHVDWLLIRYIAQTHQKLILFQEKLKVFFSPIVIPMFVCNCTCFSLSIYQLAVNPSGLSRLRMFRFVCELLVLTLEYFLISDCSETCDHCNHILRRWIENCDWYNCSPATRRGLCIILRRAQRCNKLSFHQGIVVLSREQFLKVVKVGYTFANTMRMKSSLTI